MSKRRGRRGIETSSMSFLDCICCGFGAVILLLVLVKFAEPVLLEQTTEELEAIIQSFEEEINEIRGQTRVVNAELNTVREQLSEEQRRIARLQGDLSKIEGEFKASADDATVSSTVQGRLARARQELTEEMLRLQAQQPTRSFDDRTIGGIPVDSEYIIFVIDTSGSMYNYSWPAMLQKVSETLEVYPRVKGIQVMNDNGQFMFRRYQSRWIPDTPARRKAIIESLKTWRAFSNSSPVEGITKAIQTFWAPDRKISIYVFGDEFTGSSIQDVIKTVDRINIADAQGQRRVRIHAVGFPFGFQAGIQQTFTSVRFATLMRELCRRNGGTFVALTET